MNTEILLKVLFAVLQTFIFFGVGVFALERKMFRSDSLGGLSRFAINLLTPCLIFSSITRNFSAEELNRAWIFPAIGLGMVAFNALCGYPLLLLMRHKTPERNATFLHMAALNNFLFLPLIVVANLWNEKYVGALMMMSIGFIAGQWSIGIAVMSGSSWKVLLRNLCSINLAAVVLAVLAVKFHCPLPELADSTLYQLGALAVPLQLILIGASLAVSRKKLLEYPGDMLYILVVRLLLLPAATILVLRFLPLSGMAADLAKVVSVMPASCGSVLIVREYGGDADFAGQLVISSTVASLVTMPLWLGFVL